MINLPILHGWEDALPTWMGDPKYQAVGWIYAVWQIFRTNAVLLFCLSYIPFLIRKHIFRKKPQEVLNVVQGHTSIDDVVEESRNYSGSQRLPIDWPDEWKVVEYKGFYYITHITTLATLTVYFPSRTVHDIIYVKNHVPINATTAVAMQISEQEAFELILSGDYRILEEDEMQYIPTWMNYVDVNTKIWAVLSSLPTLLQAANFNRLSFALSLAIMFLDVNRHFIYRAYDRLFHLVANFVKEKVFRDRTGLYHFFSVFSPRWRYTDPIRKRSYKISSGDMFFLHPHSKLRRLEDIAESHIEDSLEAHDELSHNVEALNDKSVGIRIWWEEWFAVRVPFLGVINLRKLLPSCLRNMVCSEEGGYRALGCNTYGYPFEFKTRLVTPKPVLVE